MFEFFWTQFDFLHDNIIFDPVFLKSSQLGHVKRAAKPYLNKLQYVSQQISNFNKNCLIMFGERKVKPKLNGSTLIKEGLILCFKGSAQNIMKTFKKLVFEKFRLAVKNEKDLLKIRPYDDHRNVAVYYFTPYLLENKVLRKETPVYVNLNHNGFTFNAIRVRILI